MNSSKFINWEENFVNFWSFVYVKSNKCAQIKNVFSCLSFNIESCT
jgi:hypothetical protein